MTLWNIIVEHSPKNFLPGGHFLWFCSPHPAPALVIHTFHSLMRMLESMQILGLRLKSTLFLVESSLFPFALLHCCIVCVCVCVCVRPSVHLSVFLCARACQYPRVFASFAPSFSLLHSTAMVFWIFRW